MNKNLKIKNIKLLNKFLTISAIFIGVFTFVLPIVTPVSAQDYGFCDFFPCPAVGSESISEGESFSLIERLAAYFFGIIFIGFIGFGIFYFIKAALRIIRSEGDETKIQEGSQIIKGVFMGVLILIIGIIGLVLLLGVLRAGRIPTISPTEPEGVDLPVINN